MEVEDAVLLHPLHATALGPTSIGQGHVLLHGPPWAPLHLVEAETGTAVALLGPTHPGHHHGPGPGHGHLHSGEGGATAGAVTMAAGGVHGAAAMTATMTATGLVARHGAVEATGSREV
jgi:hypothetical protein